MAIASRQLVKAAQKTSADRGHGLNEQFLENLYALWRKHSVVVGGKQTVIDWNVKLDCLEVFNSFYGFLLAEFLILRLQRRLYRDQIDLGIVCCLSLPNPV